MCATMKKHKNRRRSHVRATVEKKNKTCAYNCVENKKLGRRHTHVERNSFFFCFSIDSKLMSKRIFYYCEVFR